MSTSLAWPYITLSVASPTQELSTLHLNTSCINDLVPHTNTKHKLQLI